MDIAVSTLTLLKITNLSMKNKNDIILFGKYIEHNIDNTIVKKIIVITLILTTKIEVANGTLLHVV